MITYAQPTPKAPPVVSPPSALEATAQTAATRQMQVAGAGAPLRIVLGEDCIGAQVGPVWYYNGKLYLRCIWALGEAGGVQSVFLNDQPLPADVEAVHYTGTTTQGIDPWLAAAGAAQSPPETYTDTLVFTARGTTFGIAYSVFAVPQRLLTGGLEFKADFRGLKLYDPRTATTTWTDNAGLALRAFLASPWGENKSISGGDVDLADRCDELCGIAPNQEKRSRIGITLSARQPASQWRETLRTYAECFVVPDGSGYLLIPDAPASSEYTYSHAAGNLLELGSIKRAGTNQQPTVITGYYTDRSVTPWRDISIAPIKRPGVDAGTTPAIPQEIRLNGIFSAGQMTRVCTTRLNKLHLCDLSGDIHTIDDGMRVRAGTVVTLIDPRIGAGKQVRVFGSSGVNGQYVQTWVEHDNAAYSDVVVADPSTPDTSYPLPSEPPAVTAVTMTEEVYQLENGTYSSRFRITWAADDFPFLAHYVAELRDGETLIHSAVRDAKVWPTPTIQEGINYTARVVAVSNTGASGAWGTQSALAQGTQLIPGDVPSVSAYEAGGRVFGSCTPAVDIGLLRYEWRYWASGGSWATGTLIDRLDSLRMETAQMPVGDWILGVKPVDLVVKPGQTVGQYSANATTCNVTVTSDASSFLVDSHDQTNPALTNMAAYTLAPTDSNVYYITEDGVPWDTKFPNAMDTYTNPLATYHDSVTSTWLGESEDFGLLLGGSWTGEATVTDVSGSHLSYFGHGINGTDWTYLTGLSQKINARFARMKHEALTTSTLSVTVPNQRISVNSVPREETGSATSLATSAKTIFLEGDYVATLGIDITVLGSAARSHTEDNIGRNAPNPVDKHADIVLDGNTITKTGAAGVKAVRGRHPLPSSGKWRWRVMIDVGGSAPQANVVGIAGRAVSLAPPHTGTPTVFYAGNTGDKFVDGTSAAYGAAATTGDFIGVLYNADAGTIKFYKNDTAYAEITGLSGEYFPCFGLYNADAQLTVQFTESDMGGWDVEGFAPLPYAFDEHIFDSSWARVANDFLYTFKGV